MRVTVIAVSAVYDDNMHARLFGMPSDPRDDGFVGETEKVIGDHGDRIKAIERWMYTVIGAIVVISFLIGEHMPTVKEMGK